MRFSLSFLVIALFMFGAINSINARTLNSKERDKPVSANFPPPEISSGAWVLMEANSGWVVAGNNTREPLPPASITKLMMNYVIFSRMKAGEMKFTDQVSISEEAWRAEGSRMFAEVDTRIELGHLLKSTIIQSGNDAAIALSEFAGGSEPGFAQLMNQAAIKLGLQDSHFVNSTGLPAVGHVMSASDIAALSVAIIDEYPEFYKWFAEKDYTHNGITQYNRNRLLWKDSSVDGLKTGFTEAAGYCLVGSAIRDGQRWVAVVMGAKDVPQREKEVLSLLNFGFAAYKPVELLNQQGGLASVAVYGGEADEVLLQAAEPVRIVVANGREKEVKTDLQYSPYIEAPISAGQSMGVASLSLGGKPLIEVPLIAMSDIQPGSWWKQLLDSIKLRFR